MFLLLALWVLFGRHVRAGYYIAGNEEDVTKDPPRYYMTDPEPKPEGLFDKSHYLEDFKKDIPGEARFVGYTYAGRAEFPWIVDVRFDGSADYELHSTGNILTRTRILTTCRIVLYANHYRKEVEERQQVDFSVVDGLRWSMGLHQEWVALKVAYCSNFLWIRYHRITHGDFNWAHFPAEVNVEADFEGGEQKVRHIAAHPKCETNALVYDFAILALASNIVPMPPTLTAIPVFIDVKLADMTTFDLSHHIHERMMCFVGSYGKPYRNSPNPPTLDYKLKYRVYFMTWDECSKIWDLVGAPTDEGVPKPYWCPQHHTTCEYDEADRKELMCFSTRAKVGSVCDHDRGSPIVCDGKVYGFVTRGAELRLCSNIIHIPFIVVKVTAIKDYFRVTDYSKFFMPRTPSTRTPFIRGGAATPPISSALFAGIMFQLLSMFFSLLLFPLGF